MKPDLILSAETDNIGTVNTLWAWLSVDPNGNEGICATGTIDEQTGAITHMPLITGNYELIGALQAVADEMSKMSKTKKIIRVQFERKT